MAKKGLIIYGTDNDLGFIGRLALSIEKVNSENIDIFPLNISDQSVDTDPYIISQFNALKNRIDSENYKFIIIMAHGSSDRIYWGKFSGNWKLLIGNDSISRIYRSLFHSEIMILFSCFSNGLVSDRLKEINPMSSILTFGDINTEVVDYRSDGINDPTENPITIPSRRHVIRHFQKLVAYIFYEGILHYIKTECLADMENTIKKLTLRSIYGIFHNKVPIGVDQDFVHLNNDAKKFIRISLLDFYRGVIIK